jgi:hypothetical protein
MRDLVRLSLIVAVFGVCLLYNRTGTASPLLFGVEALGLAAGMTLIIPIFALTDMFQFLSAWKRHLARRKDARYVIMGSLTSSGKQAIWIGKQYVPLQTSFLRLSQTVLYEDRPAEAGEQK